MELAKVSETLIEVKITPGSLKVEGIEMDEGFDQNEVSAINLNFAKRDKEVSEYFAEQLAKGGFFTCSLLNDEDGVNYKDGTLTVEKKMLVGIVGGNDSDSDSDISLIALPLENSPCRKINFELTEESEVIFNQGNQEINIQNPQNVS